MAGAGHVFPWNQRKDRVEYVGVFAGSKYSILADLRSYSKAHSTSIWLGWVTDADSINLGILLSVLSKIIEKSNEDSLSVRTKFLSFLVQFTRNQALRYSRFTNFIAQVTSCSILQHTHTNGTSSKIPTKLFKIHKPVV